MAVDVITKIITANAIRHGSAIVLQLKFGTINADLEALRTRAISSDPTVLEDRITSRNDNPNYYN